MSTQDTITIEIVEIGDMHGGAWKVAYADFVTAMMAFFLLLWLLNVTTEEQKNAISNYFDPTHPKVSEAQSGAGGVLGGLSMTPQGSMARNTQTVRPPTPTQPRTATQAFQQDKEGKGKGEGKTKEEKKKEQAKEKIRKKEKERFDDAEKKIKQAIQEDPELAKLAENLIVDMTPEGLRIQVVDKDGEPMFASGSAQMFEKTRYLMEKLAGIVQELPNEISIRGHTDSSAYAEGATYTNWELSADRANASRRALMDAGVPAERLNNVVGKADTEHLLPDEPTSPRNRRISIVLLKEELTNPEKFEEDAEAEAENIPDEEESEAVEDAEPLPSAPPIGTFRKTPGAIEFP